MKSPLFSEMNKDGFELKIACDKLVNLCIKSVSITEYDDTCGISHTGVELPAAIVKNNSVAAGEKPSFEKCISLLPADIQDQIVKTDEYIKTLSLLKFKRQIEKNGNKITYVSSDFGFSYAIYLSNDIFDHSLQWYIITNGKPETWHRKADMMEETLNRLVDKRPDFAWQMFNNLDECVGCYGSRCLAQTAYQFHGRKKVVCHGKLKFKMGASGFEDVRTFIEEINRLAKETV